MKLEEFAQMIADAKDKVSVLTNAENINNCENITVGDITGLMDEYLTDNEKVDVLKCERFKKYGTIRNFVMESLKTDDAKLKLIQDKEILDLCKGSNELRQLVVSLGPESLMQVITNEETVLKVDFFDIQLSKILCKLPDDNLKLELAKKYELGKFEVGNVIQSVNDDLKVELLKGGEYSFSDDKAQKIIFGMPAEKIMDIISNDRVLLDRYGIEPDRLISSLNDEKQVQICQSIDKLGLETYVQRMCLASLSKVAKSKIDEKSLAEDVRDALGVTRDRDGKIVLDFKGDMERYRGMDELISVKPMAFSADEREKFKKLASICPNMTVSDNIDLGKSTAQEYLNGEAWIEEVESGIDPEWSDVEKIAYIDNAIGKRISYTPDFDTEVSDDKGARALWKILDSGYGVCNGISQVEQYMLKRVGIESQIVGGQSHAFLKIPNMEVKCANGEVKTGSSILDPTWNLAEQRYGARPNNFLKSYEEIRKHDVRSNGTDAECHKNDEELSDATLDVDDETLRQIYVNVGVVTRADRKFPITDLMEESEKIDNLKLDSKESVKRQLELLERIHPDFVTCQNSTDSILKGVLLAGDNLQYDRMIIDRAFAKNDERKKAVQYVYMELPDSERVFFYADREHAKFVEASGEEFEEKFSCYEEDLSLYERKSTLASRRKAYTRGFN